MEKMPRQSRCTVAQQRELRAPKPSIQSVSGNCRMKKLPQKSRPTFADSTCSCKSAALWRAPSLLERR